MPQNTDATSTGDFDPKDFTRTVDLHGVDIADIKKGLAELQDKKLDEKICKAISDSTHIQDKISSIVWRTIREKLVWIILTLAALLLWDSIKSLIAELITKIK